MIESFRHKGLRRLFEDGDGRGVRVDHVQRIKAILTVLDSSMTLDGLRLPTYRLHALTGDLKGYWAVTVRANWRVVFRFEDGVARDVDLVDYH